LLEFLPSDQRTRFANGDTEVFVSIESLLNFDPVHQRVVFHRGELDHILPARICGFRELFDHSFVLGPNGSEDIEVSKHRRAVDASR